MTPFWIVVLIGAVASATPLVLAGLGEAVLERSGAGFNLGIEGILLCGALAGVRGSALAGPWAGVAFGLVAGVLFGLLYALGVRAGVDAVLVGIALSVLGTGLSTYLSQVFAPAGQPNPTVPTLPAVRVPGLASLPVIGPLFADVGVATLLALVFTALTSWLLRGTRFGLRLRASGDDADVARVRGIAVHGYRTVAALIAGGAAGLAGAVMALATIGTFTPLMTGGRGFVVLAVVIVARRTPAGVLGGALLFAVFDSLALLAQTRDLGLPVELYQGLPYLLTLVVLCLQARHRSRKNQESP